MNTQVPEQPGSWARNPSGIDSQQSKHRAFTNNPPVACSSPLSSLGSVSMKIFAFFLAVIREENQRRHGRPSTALNPSTNFVSLTRDDRLRKLAVFVGDSLRCPRSWRPPVPTPLQALCRACSDPALCSSETDSENDEATEGGADASLWCTSEDALVNIGERGRADLLRDDGSP